MREITFEVNGERYDATVDETPIKRSALTRGQLTVEHPSESYAIFMGLGSYTARPIVEEESEMETAIRRATRDNPDKAAALREP